jgi:hypothetical protein
LPLEGATLAPIIAETRLKKKDLKRAVEGAGYKVVNS